MHLSLVHDGTPIADEETWIAAIQAHRDKTFELYSDLLAAKVAPEVARGVLPQSMYTEFIETGSLYAYARLCRLRLDPQAQREIQVYASALSEELATRFPVSWLALKKEWASSE